MTCHVLALHLLHCYCVKQFKGTFGSIKCVLNCQLEYVFYTWENAQNLGLLYYFVTKEKVFPGDAQLSVVSV